MKMRLTAAQVSRLHDLVETAGLQAVEITGLAHPDSLDWILVVLTPTSTMVIRPDGDFTVA